MELQLLIGSLVASFPEDLTGALEIVVTVYTRELTEESALLHRS